MKSSAMAQKTWEMENNVESIGSIDTLYRYNSQQQQEILSAKPWSKE